MQAGFICRTCLARLGHHRRPGPRNASVSFRLSEPANGIVRHEAFSQRAFLTSNRPEFEHFSIRRSSRTVRPSGGLVSVRSSKPSARPRLVKTFTSASASASLKEEAGSSNATSGSRRLAHAKLQPARPTGREGRTKARGSHSQRHDGLDPIGTRAYLAWKNKIRHGALKNMRQKFAQKKAWAPFPERKIRILRWLLRLDGVDDMAAAWESLSFERRQRIWPNVMGSALIACPEKALTVLQATMKPLPPGYAVQDSVQFLALWQRSLTPAEAVSHAAGLADLARNCVELYHDTHGARLAFRQNTIYLVASGVDNAKLQQFYDSLKSRNQKLHPNTLLHFADRFAKDKQCKEAALEIATAVAKAGGADLNSAEWSSLCTSILSTNAITSQDQDGKAAMVGRLETLLQHGLAPNLINFTALIRALCTDGHTATAWTIFDVMQTHGLKPDSVLIATLLEGARTSSLSVDQMDRATSLAAEHRLLDVPSWNSLLSSVLTFSVAVAKERNLSFPRTIPAFGPMLYFYSRVFHLEPLQHLIPIDLEAFAKSWPEMPKRWEKPSKIFPVLERAAASIDEKLHPTGTTLSIMFTAYTRSLSKASSLLSLYSHIRHLVQSRNRLYAAFMAEKKTLLHDVIIHRLCEHPGMLRAALDIVGDMLQSSGGNRASSGAPVNTDGAASQKTNKLSHPLPSAYTWNILLQGFMAQRQTASGEHIIAMMKQNSIEPTLVTWNTLLKGYARVYDVDKAIRTLQILEEDNLQADDYTMRAFARLARNESALKKIEAAMEDHEEGSSKFVTASRLSDYEAHDDPRASVSSVAS